MTARVPQSTQGRKASCAVDSKLSKRGQQISAATKTAEQMQATMKGHRYPRSRYLECSFAFF